MELFDLPPQQGQRLEAETHHGVFGGLPARLSAALHTPEIGDLVLQLLDRGWRQGQLAARIGALPSGADPIADIRALLEGFLEQVPPDARWREEKRERAQLKASAAIEQPATEESRQAWLARIRDDLGVRRSAPREPARRTRPACALCGQESSYFVTREVRLCDGCVEQLTTGALQLPNVG
ncbi:MAG: hypothetical protein JWL79_1072 [Frankiales bacterium]|jgi:hypothetical protein|nr:hypothetical protein [Frankiales bacterium]